MDEINKNPIKNIKELLKKSPSEAILKNVVFLFSIASYRFSAILQYIAYRNIKKRCNYTVDDLKTYTRELVAQSILERESTQSSDLAR